jgi:hypothetical protein
VLTFTDRVSSVINPVTGEVSARLMTDQTAESGY